MLSKVKKLGSKLFGDNAKEGQGQEGSTPKFSLKSFSRTSNVHEATDAGQQQQPEHSRPSTALPPVQVTGQPQPQQAMSPNGPRPPAAIAGMLTPTNTGRRKSTPAALDMQLRTAEGRAAIEELVNAGGKKQMVFGQYFGGPQGSKAAVPATGPDKATARFVKNTVIAGSGPSLSDKQIRTVLEDDDEAPSVTEPDVAPAVIAVNASSASQSAAPVAQKPLATAAPAAPSPAPAPAPQPAPQPAPPTRISIATMEQPPLQRTKVLSMSQQLPNGMARKYWSLADYSIVRKMYTGYASTVYQATCKRTLEQVALKVYHMENLCELNHFQVYREIRLHSALQHQNIIQLYCSFQEGNDVVMVQEYAEGGDLYRLLHRNGGRLAERQAVEMVLHPFLLALHYLHTHGIMHRDIKPENVLFTEHRVLKLADFGLAIDLNEERAVTRAGTLDYMAPEVLRCPPKNLPQENKNNTSLYYNNSVDAWAVGVFAYELIVGFPPFAGENQLDSVDKIIHSTPAFPEKISELAKAFITAVRVVLATTCVNSGMHYALKKHPGDRPTVIEMLHNPWIRSYQRRTSVLIPQHALRRRSSVSYNSNAAAAPPATVLPAHLDAHGLTPTASMKQHGVGAPHAADAMSPQEIEAMIHRLQIGQ
ncbi:hypothetical protein QJQ45_022034 [Haematococcus lacustris]|nr:hypothetical protein QJQ45_022034 [Haematococcus lacustris]